MNRKYISDYSDPNSRAFKQLAAEVEPDVLRLLQSNSETAGAGITGVKMTGVTNGSVIVDMTVASSARSLPASSIRNSINQGIAKGSLARLGAVGAVEVTGISFVTK